MLEALISYNDTATDKPGDIICVKKAPAVWGSKETTVVYLQDDELETTVVGVKIYPYAVYEYIETPFEVEKHLINRSGYRLDVSQPKEIYLKSDLIYDPQER